MRLGDLDTLYGIESLLNTDIVQKSQEAAWLMSQVLHDIQASPTIDPETLPIVRQLREELERVTKERDAAKEDAANARHSLMMAIFAKCEFVVKFDSYGKSVQLIRCSDEKENTQ